MFPQLDDEGSERRGHRNGSLAPIVFSVTSAQLRAVARGWPSEELLAISARTWLRAGDRNRLHAQVPPAAACRANLPKGCETNSRRLRLCLDLHGTAIKPQSIDRSEPWPSHAVKSRP